MSKLKLLGNSGGDGVITLTAPNTNADRTITLPDSTDSLAGQTQVNRLGGRKNLVINGDMRISQRGDFTTSVSVPSSTSTYILDRWATYGSGTNVNASQGTVTLPNGTHAYTFKTEAVSAGGSWLHPFQKVEWDRSYRGKTITLSCWVKTNLAGQGMRVCDGATCIVTGSIPSDETWNHVSATFVLQSASDPAFFQAHPAFGGSSVAGSYIEFTHMQVELGDQATDFEHRSYGEELALCQRYYEKVTSTRLTGYHPTSVRHGYLFKTVKRVAPTVIISSAINSAGTSISLSGNAPTIYGVTIYGSLAATSSGIQGTITADAEL